MLYFVDNTASRSLYINVPRLQYLFRSILVLSIYSSLLFNTKEVIS